MPHIDLTSVVYLGIYTVFLWNIVDIIGYKRGKKQGIERGDFRGYTRGFNEGYDKGLSIGEDIGYKKGYNEGYADCNHLLTNTQPSLETPIDFGPLDVLGAYIKVRENDESDT